MTTAQVSKSTVIAALHAWINQRPGLEFGDYGDIKSYRAEIRQIGKDLAHARTLLRAVELRDSITGEMIVEAAKHAYSGRLTINYDAAEDHVSVDYCTGQYWPTEYRRAVCAVLASVLWDYWRENAPVDAGPTESHSNLQNLGAYLRKTARCKLGRSIGDRWFN